MLSEKTIAKHQKKLYTNHELLGGAKHEYKRKYSGL